MKLKLLKVKEAFGEAICSPKIVAEVMKEEGKIDRECLWVLHLNSGNMIIEKELVSMGTVNHSVVHPREVFKKAIINGATCIITAHNHPSGRIKPSPEDIEIWDKLKEAGEILGIKAIENIILTPSGEYYSDANDVNRGFRYG